MGERGLSDASTRCSNRDAEATCRHKHRELPRSETRGAAGGRGLGPDQDEAFWATGVERVGGYPSFTSLRPPAGANKKRGIGEHVDVGGRRIGNRG
jgi:hypothetical protein